MCYLCDLKQKIYIWIAVNYGFVGKKLEAWESESELLSATYKCMTSKNILNPQIFLELCYFISFSKYTKNSNSNSREQQFLFPLIYFARVKELHIRTCKWCLKNIRHGSQASFPNSKIEKEKWRIPMPRNDLKTASSLFE